TTFQIVKVEDTRNEKRARVINRAKELVKLMLTTTVPDSREISELVEAEVKSSTVTVFGPEKIPLDLTWSAVKR
ncbi:TOPRIM domain protein, partial [mine drainage metagenome]